MENMQRWYNQDKEQSLQAEFEKLFEQWAGQKENVAVN